MVFEGVGAYTDGLRYIRKLSLWHYFLAPAVITLALLALMLASAFTWGTDLGGYLFTLYPYVYGAGVVSYILTALGFLLVLAIGLVVYKNAVLALSAPVMSMMSERIEQELVEGYTAPAFSPSRFLSDLRRGIRLGLYNGSKEFFATIALLVLGLIPLLAPLAALGIFLLQAYYAGFCNLDYTLERHYTFKESVAFVRTYREFTLGNGIVFMLLLLTGIGFLIALPLSTASATVFAVQKVYGEKGVRLRSV